jgi:hypothetical protein
LPQLIPEITSTISPSKFVFSPAGAAPDT